MEKRHDGLFSFEFNVRNNRAYDLDGKEVPILNGIVKDDAECELVCLWERHYLLRDRVDLYITRWDVGTQLNEMRLDLAEDLARLIYDHFHDEIYKS
jgi:hypothetical protein